MTNEKRIGVLQLYIDELTSRGIPCQELTDYETPTGMQEREIVLGHVMWMCVVAIDYVQTGQIDKADRWLGHIQGILTERGIYSVSEERKHSRS